MKNNGVLIVAVGCMVLSGGCKNGQGTGAIKGKGPTGKQASGGKVTKLNNASRATITGVVMNVETEKPLSGVTVVQRKATTLVKAVTGAGGTFTLVTKGGSAAYVEAKKAGMISTLKLSAKFGSANLELFPAAFLDKLYAAAGLPKRDASRGAVMVVFPEKLSSRVGATLSAGHGGSFTVGDDDKPVKSSKLIPGGISMLFFVNVAPGSTEVKLSGGGCKLTPPSIKQYKVVAGTLTEIEVSCRK